MDDFISDEEFKLIMEELEKYKAMKEEIRSNAKKKLKEEEKETLIERGRQEALSPFGSWLKRIMVAPCRIKLPSFRCRCVCEIGDATHVDI